MFIIIGAAVLVVVIGIVASLFLLGGHENDEYFEIGGDQIPSVMYILGEKRKISSFTTTTSRSSEKLVVEYSVDSNQGYEMEEYAQALMDDFGFVSVNGFDFSGRRGSDIQFAALSEEDDEYVVLVSIDFDNRGYTLTVTRGVGTISFNENDGPDDPTLPPDETDDPDDPTPPPDDLPETDEPVIENTPAPETPAPSANEIDVICAGILLGNTVELAQAKVPSGVTVVEMTATGDFILRMSTDMQNRIITEAIADIEGLIMDIYNNHPGVDNIRWNPDNFNIIYLTINDVFASDSNKQQSSEALLSLALYGPMVQVFQGMGLNSVTLIAFGDEEMDNIVGELYSPACLYEIAG